VLEIATKLHPADVFSLSFTSKWHYAVISTIPPYQWKRSRQIFMPERILGPVGGMTEKEYAWHLTTDRCANCHFVPTIGSVSMFWEIGFKGCRACFDLLTNDYQGWFHETIYSKCFPGYFSPSFTWRRNTRDFVNDPFAVSVRRLQSRIRSPKLLL
jgi:hypothetical protein